jgi:NADPH:quinone reductase-like Zn-dependent oxidoreductase
MGHDVVGEIDQLGEGVSGFQLGDRVVDATVVGSNALLSASGRPSDLGVGEAATLILSWTTGDQLIHRAARVRRGRRVLVHGAGGAVGQALLALGRSSGLRCGALRTEHVRC